MKLLILAALTLTLAGGCVHGLGDDAPICRPATPVPVASQVTASGQPPAAKERGVGAAVLEAEALVVQLHVSAPPPASLLGAAWLAVRGIAPPEWQMAEPPAVGTGSPDEKRAAYKTAFDELGRRLDADERAYVIYVAISALAAALHDDHTAYLPEIAGAAEQKNSIYSFGVNPVRTQQGLLAREVIPGSPAAAAGLKPGDAFGMREDADHGASIHFSRARNGEAPEERTVPLAATELPWYRTELIGGDVGLLRIFEFPGDASCDSFASFRRDFDGAVGELKKAGARAWLIDLRDNGGGSALAASYVAGGLGYEGLVATVRQANGYENRYEALGSNRVGDAPIADLVNGGSASAAEVLAYTLETGRGAEVVGTQTAGKVIAAAIVPVPTGALEITAARIDVGPDQHVLDKIGVMPTKRVELDSGLLAAEGKDSQRDAAVSDLERRLASH